METQEKQNMDEPLGGTTNWLIVSESLSQGEILRGPSIHFFNNARSGDPELTKRLELTVIPPEKQLEF